MLLPATNFTKQKVKDSHDNKLHAGINKLLAQLRQMYFISGEKQLARNVLHYFVTQKKVQSRSTPVSKVNVVLGGYLLASTKERFKKTHKIVNKLRKTFLVRWLPSVNMWCTNCTALGTIGIYVPKRAKR